jgi:ATP-dependent DNA helicase
LNFLLPTIFANWEQFESWFDFSELQDEEGTEEFLQDKMKQDLVKKMHLILQPLLLRRIKADVEHLLPKKREYVLYAPMTKEQTDLYNVINNKAVDTRQYLEDKVVERLTGATNTPARSRATSPGSITKTEGSDSEEIPISKLAIKKKGKGRPPKSATSKSTPKSAPKNAFQQMMERKASTAKSTPARKRKAEEPVVTPAPKSAKSSRSSTPATSVRGRKVRKGKYAETEASDEDELSDDEFERKLAEEIAVKDDDIVSQGSAEDIERARTLELASE